MKIFLLGATGLVGSAALEQALGDARIAQLIAPTRRALPGHAKLVNPVAPQLDLLLPAAADWAVDAVICALGSTMGQAGSKEAFRQVDYVLPMAFAALAHRQGAQACALVSAPGASAASAFFYPRVKGELERDMNALGFRSLTIVRPGMIGGERAEFRLAERLVLPLAGLLRPLLPRGLRVNPAANIARVLIESVVAPVPGCRKVTSKDLV